MKNVLLGSACAFAALAASPALAGAPGSPQSDTAFITQGANTGTAASFQTGSNDFSEIDQLGSTSSQNVATATMNGIVGGRSVITQSGTSNLAQVTTADDGTVQTGASAPITISTINQSGSMNQAFVDQLAQTNASPTTSAISQSASGNYALVIQRDNTQSSVLAQTSDGNIANIYQGLDNSTSNTSFGNHSEINQGGSAGANYALVTQTHAMNSQSYLTQFGSNGSAKVTQADDGTGLGNNTSTTSQYGAHNLAIVSQTGYNNSSTVTSIKDLNSANIVQVGHDNASTVHQSADTGSLALSGSEIGVAISPGGGTNQTSMTVVNQFGSYLSSTAKSDGASDFAFVRQGTPGGFDSHLFSWVDQTSAGSSNIAFVDQVGTGQFSYFSQSGVGNQAGATSNGSNGLGGALGIHQAGNGNYSLAHQTGSNGTINVVQNNNGALTRSIRPGLDTPPGDNTSLVNNYSIINQDGMGNSALVTQTGDGNLADVDQFAGSSGNVATISQSLDGGVAAVTQFGAGNNALIVQGSH